MAGYKAPIFLLGIGVPPADIKQGKGFGPLPFIIGLSSAVTTQGRGHGPLPFTIGLSSAVTTQGRGHGPLPFTIGTTESTDIIIPIEDIIQAGGESFFDNRRKLSEPSILINDDEEVLEIIAALIGTGVLN